MTEKGENKSIRIFKVSEADPERVKTSMGNPVFKSREALQELSFRILGIEDQILLGQDITKLKELLNASYEPAIEAFNKQLNRQGWTREEISAANVQHLQQQLYKKKRNF
jgi:hypothetical protein